MQQRKKLSIHHVFDFNYLLLRHITVSPLPAHDRIQRTCTCLNFAVLLYVTSAGRSIADQGVRPVSQKASTGLSGRQQAEVHGHPQVD